MGINFGGWPEALHEDFEQVKRIASAKKLKDSDIAVSENGQHISVRGSAAVPYETWLTECTCPDFAIRQAPCKHIYKLAMMNGLLDSLPEYTGKSSSDIASEMTRYRSLYMDKKISTSTFVQLCSALIKLDKKAGSKDGAGDFDTGSEIERLRSLYRDGKISADSYVGLCSVLAKLK